MLWKEVEEEYGKEMADKMKKSEYLMGITFTIKDGKVDIPESDIILAYKGITGEEIDPFEWD